MDLWKLKQLLNSYLFADVSMRKHSASMLPYDRAMLYAERAEAFWSLL